MDIPTPFLVYILPLTCIPPPFLSLGAYTSPLIVIAIPLLDYTVPPISSAWLLDDTLPVTIAVPAVVETLFTRIAAPVPEITF